MYCQWKCKLEQAPCNATGSHLVELDKGIVYDPILHFHSSYPPEKCKCIPWVPKDMSGHNDSTIIHNNPQRQATQMSSKVEHMGTCRHLHAVYNAIQKCKWTNYRYMQYGQRWSRTWRKRWGKVQRINAERTHLNEVLKQAKLITGDRGQDSGVPFGEEPKRGLLGCQPGFSSRSRLGWCYLGLLTFWYLIYCTFRIYVILFQITSLSLPSKTHTKKS